MIRSFIILILTKCYLGDEIKAVEMRGICGGYEGKPKGKRPLGRPGIRWEV